MKWTIYCHTHVESGRRYVGLTKKTWRQRWDQHVCQAKSLKCGRSHLANAVRKYGKNAFSHEILEVCQSLEVANLAEECWIELLETRDPLKGFNLAKGGAHGEIKFRRNPWDDPEFRKKGIAAAKARWANPVSRANNLAASKAGLNTPESKAKRSAIMKVKARGFVCDPEHGKRMRAFFAGRPVSSETRAKISSANRTRSPEVIRKIADSNSKPRSPEYMAKLKAANSNAVATPTCKVHGLLFAGDYRTRRKSPDSDFVRVVCKECAKAEMRNAYLKRKNRISDSVPSILANILGQEFVLTEGRLVIAFNFYGTFSTGQFESFRNFSKLQEQDLAARILWLKAEVLRIGIFTTDYGQEVNVAQAGVIDFDVNDKIVGNQTLLPTSSHPIAFSVAPSNSYAAKLMLAYKILGGFPEREMLLKTRDIPVFKLRGTPLTNASDDPDAGYSTMFSNGRRERSGQRFDRDTGVQVSKIKNWQLEVIKRKRESLEFKIKKALDYSDQIQEEILQLVTMLTDDNKSLSSLLVNVRVLMFAPGRQTVLEDEEDLFGLTIGQKVDPTVPGEWVEAPSKGNIK